MFFQIGIQLGIALSYLSLLTASPAAHVLVPRETRATNPSYSTAFLGDDGSRRPGARLYNDLTLLTDGGGHRRIGKIQIWCGDWVYGMIPWYYDTLGVASTSRHWQYAKNLHGEYKELILGQDEYITAITSNVCTYNSGTKLTYLELITSGNNAHAKQHLYCGEQSPVNTPECQIMTSFGNARAGHMDRAFLAFTGAAMDDGLIGIQSHWIDIGLY